MSNRFDRYKKQKGRLERLVSGEQRIGLSDYQSAKKRAIRERPKN